MDISMEKKDWKERLKELKLSTDGNGSTNWDYYLNSFLGKDELKVLNNFIEQELDKAREDGVVKLSKELATEIKKIQKEYEDDTEVKHSLIDNLIVERLGGELEEMYTGGWGWYS